MKVRLKVQSGPETVWHHNLLYSMQNYFRNRNGDSRSSVVPFAIIFISVQDKKHLCE